MFDLTSGAFQDWHVSVKLCKDTALSLQWIRLWALWAGKVFHASPSPCLFPPVKQVRLLQLWIILVATDRRIDPSCSPNSSQKPDQNPFLRTHFKQLDGLRMHRPSTTSTWFSTKLLGFQCRCNEMNLAGMDHIFLSEMFNRAPCHATFRMYGPAIAYHNSQGDRSVFSHPLVKLPAQCNLLSLLEAWMMDPITRHSTSQVIWDSFDTLISVKTVFLPWNTAACYFEMTTVGLLWYWTSPSFLRT